MLSVKKYKLTVDFEVRVNDLVSDCEHEQALYNRIVNDRETLDSVCMAFLLENIEEKLTGRVLSDHPYRALTEAALDCPSADYFAEFISDNPEEDLFTESAWAVFECFQVGVTDVEVESCKGIAVKHVPRQMMVQ